MDQKLNKYYDVLGITPKATDQEVSSAYHQSTQQWRPYWSASLADLRKAYEKIMAARTANKQQSIIAIKPKEKNETTEAGAYSGASRHPIPIHSAT